MAFCAKLGPMDMIFDLPSETNVRLLKNIISQFFSKYSKSSITNRTLQELFRMALKKSVTFVVFEIFSNFVPMPNFLNAFNC